MRHAYLTVQNYIFFLKHNYLLFFLFSFSEREAAVMKANSWLYHYYMVQSRLQYSLAYGGQSPTSLAAFYPGMQNATAAGFPPGQSPFEGKLNQEPIY